MRWVRLVSPDASGALVLAEQMPVQPRRPRRLRAGFGVKVHHSDNSRVRSGQERARIVRMTPAVKEDQMACVRPDDGAVALDGVYARGIRVMCENNLASVSGAKISAAEMSSELIRINKAVESHGCSAVAI